MAKKKAKKAKKAKKPAKKTAPKKKAKAKKAPKKAKARKAAPPKKAQKKAAPRKPAPRPQPVEQMQAPVAQAPSTVGSTLSGFAGGLAAGSLGSAFASEHPESEEKGFDESEE
jgi:hypothetical protein